jgi:S1-C subfamily serine protease
MTFPGSKPPGWRLKPIGKYGLPSSIDVARGGLTVGRQPASDLAITGERWTMVSGLHARLEFEEGQLVVRDLDSRNGTFVNDERIEAAQLCSGDVLQLGLDGPRFLIFHASGIEATSMVESRAVAAAAERSTALSLGDTAMLTFRRALGLDEAQAATKRVERRQGKHLLLGTAALGLVALAGVVGMSRIERENRDEATRANALHAERVAVLERESARRVSQVELRSLELERANRALAGKFEAGLTTMGRELELRIANSYVARAAWEDQRDGLEAQRGLLESRLEELRKSRDGSQEEITALSRRLDGTTAELARYSPQELEAGKLAEVTHVRAAVVMIETRVVFREQETRRLLHLSHDELRGGSAGINLRDEGEVLDQRSSGSGFVVSPEGYILTNAHVVVPNDFREPMSITDDSEVLAEVELSVVFSGTSLRYKAELVHLDDEGEHDFALIKIEPFEGVPHLKLPDLNMPPPEPGTEVYLSGFPLGTFAVQEGDRVIASTLKGILSRRVGPYVQIDAGVHPGISGGPVTDSSGRLIGVVCSVQSTPKGEIAATIGYALPISAARRVLAAELFR